VGDDDVDEDEDEEDDDNDDDDAIGLPIHTQEITTKKCVKRT
jgi:hypothetical protein